MDLIKRQITSAGKTVEELEPSTLLKGLENGAAHFGKQPGNISKGYTELSYDPAIPPLSISRKNENKCLHQIMYSNVHSNTIHNSQRSGSNQMSTSS